MSDQKDRVEEVKERMRAALPHFRHAVEMARQDVSAEGGSVNLGVMCTWPDGRGRVFVRFEADSFFDDIAVILGLPTESTPEEDLEARAASFVDMLRANGIKAG